MPIPRISSRGLQSTRLAGVELRNFKSVRAAQVELGPLTVIAGANSAGKSSLIQAILAMTQVSRRRVEGRRFPLNDDLTQLGTFETLRHQGVDRDAAIVVAARFRSTERDVRWSEPMLRIAVGRPDNLENRGSGDSPVDLRWAVEVDSSVADQVGSAQMSAVEMSISGDSLEFSARLERTAEESTARLRRDEIGAAVFAFSGTIRSPDETPVLDATITSGQATSFFGVPPEPAIRVRDWFRTIRDLEVDEESRAAASQEPSRAVEEAAWGIASDVPAPPDFVDWYLRMDETAQEGVEARVLAAFEADRARSKVRPGGVERLAGRAPAWLTSAQRACSGYLANQVRYVGPLRQAPHQPFSAAPDPDAGDVGVAGQHVAAVLQAFRSRTDRFPVPRDGPDGDRLERLPLGEAVNRWLRFFGLADSLTVREDAPLVLGIDLVPPGLTRPVPLGAVGVGVSQVLPVVVQCLVAGPGALVILEQPELHLHPGAQQLLADFLLACTAWGQNILVESHSEYLVLRLRRRVAEDVSEALLRRLVILFAVRDAAGATTYRPVELTETGGVVEWPDGFFDQGPDEAHQLLIAAAERQRRDERTPRAQR